MPPGMMPVLFEVFGVKVYSHHFFLVLGVLVLLGWVASEARRRHWPASEVVPIGLGGFVGAMVGARLSILFFNGWDTAPIVLNFYSLFDPRIGPGSILGAIAGAYIGGYLASRVIGKTGCACDAFAPGMALGMAVGRIGDFLSGEDGIGKPTTLPWGVQPVAGADYVVHPAPLYDAAFNLVWFVVLFALRDNPRFQDGRLLKFGVAGYAAVRFFIEFVRNNQVIALGLTGQQFFCLGLLALVAVYYAWTQRRRPAAQLV
jgi:phosphatidylglycerol:prolipoprotein diacylglycerol transferase